MLKNILIVWGTSGLGLDLAQKYSALWHTCFITGRQNPNIAGLHFLYFDITDDSIANISQVETIVWQLPTIHTLIYAAGYRQEWHIDDFTDAEILTMTHVGLSVPMLLIRRLKKETDLLKIILITSTSSFTAREYEPLYCSTKAGLHMLWDCLVLDQHIGKVLIVAPWGMKTPFRNPDKDTSEYLDPDRVWDQVIELSTWAFKYKFAKIFRNPARVEIVETR